MNIHFNNSDYHAAFDSDPESRIIFAFSRWIELQGGRVIWSNLELIQDYFTFQKESDAVMFVLKWGSK